MSVGSEKQLEPKEQLGDSHRTGKEMSAEGKQ